MLKTTRSITINGTSTVEVEGVEKVVANFTANIKEDQNITINQFIQNQKLYIANKTQVRKDKNDFEDYVDSQLIDVNTGVYSMKIETGKIIRGAQWIGELRQRGIKMTPSVAMLLTNNLLNMQNITSAYEQQAKELFGDAKTFGDLTPEQREQFKELIEVEVEIAITPIPVNMINADIITVDEMLDLQYLFKMD